MKKIALFVGLVVSAMLFVGCANKQAPAADNTAAAQAQPAPAKAKDLKGESI